MVLPPERGLDGWMGWVCLLCCGKMVQCRVLDKRKLNLIFLGSWVFIPGPSLAILGYPQQCSVSYQLDHAFCSHGEWNKQGFFLDKSRSQTSIWLFLPAGLLQWRAVCVYFSPLMKTCSQNQPTVLRAYLVNALKQSSWVLKAWGMFKQHEFLRSYSWNKSIVYMFVWDVCKCVCTHVEERGGHWFSCCITFYLFHWSMTSHWT